MENGVENEENVIKVEKRPYHIREFINFSLQGRRPNMKITACLTRGCISHILR